MAESQDRIETDLEALVDKVPPRVRTPLEARLEDDNLLEVVLDLGRQPEARFLDRSVPLGDFEVSEEDIAFVTDRVGMFGEDNRAGIERTLHRISAIRNRTGKTVGLTLRVGRAVYGTIRIVEDLIFTGKGLLLVGKPGVGKTTMLREVARVLADDADKRVIVVDTSNEIAGDGDIPHPGIGHARRMQVPSPLLQHAVMIEAVENHMPEVIVIDEIGTEQEANAARTIAERGVQLIATAHGNTLENLVMNPVLSDLVGGIESVTLGDIEARRRRTQKTVLERRSSPTFDVLVEIRGWNEVAIHSDVAEVVDRMLRGSTIEPEIRSIGKDGTVVRIEPKRPASNGAASARRGAPLSGGEGERPAVTNILPYGVNKGKLHQVVRAVRAPVEVVGDMRSADMVLTTKNYYRRRTTALKTAEDSGKPVYVLRKTTLPQIEQFVRAVMRKQGGARDEDAVSSAIDEAQKAAGRIDDGEPFVELSPQESFIRRLQHQVADSRSLSSTSTGREPTRRVVLHRQ